MQIEAVPMREKVPFPSCLDLSIFLQNTFDDVCVIFLC